MICQFGLMRKLMAALFLLASCSGGKHPEPRPTSTSAAPDVGQVRAARQRDIADASLRLAGAAEALADAAKQVAEDHAAEVRLQLGNLAMLDNTSLYNNAGGAGVAARFAAEDRARAKAVAGLSAAKRSLEAGLSLLRAVLRVRTLIRNDAGHQHMTELVQADSAILARADAMVAQSRRLQSDRAELMVERGAVDRASAALEEAITGLNQATSRLGAPPLVLGYQVRPIRLLKPAAPLLAPADAAPPAAAELAATEMEWTTVQRRLIGAWKAAKETCDLGTDMSADMRACTDAADLEQRLNAAGVCRVSLSDVDPMRLRRC